MRSNSPLSSNSSLPSNPTPPADPTPSPTPAQGGRSFIEQARRSQIIEAAIVTVADNGYQNASLSRIAKTAGISKSVISYHFTDKDELLEEVVVHLFHTAWYRVEPLLAAESTAIGKLRVWITEQLANMSRSRHEVIAIGQIVGNHRAADRSLRFETEIESGVNMLAGIIADGQRSGELVAGDPTVAAITVGHGIEGVINRAVLHPDTDLAHCAEELTALITRALAER